MPGPPSAHWRVIMPIISSRQRIHDPSPGPLSLSRYGFSLLHTDSGVRTCQLFGLRHAASFAFASTTATRHGRGVPQGDRVGVIGARLIQRLFGSFSSLASPSTASWPVGESDYTLTATATLLVRLGGSLARRPNQWSLSSTDPGLLEPIPDSEIRDDRAMIQHKRPPSTGSRFARTSVDGDGGDDSLLPLRIRLPPASTSSDVSCSA